MIWAVRTDNVANDGQEFIFSHNKLSGDLWLLGNWFNVSTVSGSSALKVHVRKMVGATPDMAGMKKKRSQDYLSFLLQSKTLPGALQ